MTNSRGKEGWESRRAIRQGREVQNGPVQKKEVPEKSERKLREARNELERIQRSLPIEGGSAALVPAGEYESYLDELARYKLRAEKIGEEFPEALSDAKAAQENSTRVMLEVGELMAAKKFSAPAEQSKPPTGPSSVPYRGDHLTKEELEALVGNTGAVNPLESGTYSIGEAEVSVETAARRAEENVAYSDRIAQLNYDIHEARKTNDKGRLAVLEDMKHALVQGEFVQGEGARGVERGPEPEKEAGAPAIEMTEIAPIVLTTSENRRLPEDAAPTAVERLKKLAECGEVNLEDLRRRMMKHSIAEDPRAMRGWLEEETRKGVIHQDDTNGLNEALLRAEQLKRELKRMKEETQGEGVERGQERIRVQEAYRKLTNELTDGILVLLGADHWFKKNETILNQYTKVNQGQIEHRLNLLELKSARVNYAASRVAAERVGSSWWPPENWLKKGDAVRTERAEKARQREEAERIYEQKKGETVRESLQGRLREHERETKVLGDAAVEQAKGALMERLRLGLSWLGEQNLYTRFAPNDREKLKWYERYLYRSLSAKAAITYSLLGISAATGVAAVGVGTVFGLRTLSSLTGFFGTRMALRSLWEKFEFKELGKERIGAMKSDEVYEEFARRAVHARLGGKDTQGDPTVRRLRRAAAEKARREAKSAPEGTVRAVVEELNKEAEKTLQRIYDRRTREATESGRISVKEAVTTGGAAGVAALLVLGAPRWLVEKTGISDAVGSLVEKLREGLAGHEEQFAGAPPAGEVPKAEGSSSPAVDADRAPTPRPEEQTIPESATPSAEPKSPKVPDEPAKSTSVTPGGRAPSSAELYGPEERPEAVEQAARAAGKVVAEATKKNFDFDLGAIESGDSFESKLIAGMKKSQELREALGVDGKLSGEELNRAIERRAHLVAIESGVADKGLNLDPETRIVVEGGKVRLEGAGGTYAITNEAVPEDLKKAAARATEELAKKAEDVENLKIPPIEEWTKYAKPKEMSEDTWRALINREDAFTKRLESNIEWLKAANVPAKERLITEASAALDVVRERGFSGTNAGGEFVQERYNAIQSVLAGESARIEALREPFRTTVAAADSIGEPMHYPSGVTDAGVSEAAKVAETGTPPAIPREIIETFAPKAGLEKYPDFLSTTKRAREVANELLRLGKINPYANELKQSLETVWKNFNESPSAVTWKQVQNFIENHAKYIKDYGPKIEAGGK